MAVAYRSSGAACLATATTHNITVTDVQPGDLILMGTVTIDTIYVRGLPKVGGLGAHGLRHMHDVTHNGFVDVFWTIATGTSHTFVVTLSATGICETWWAAFSGVDQANPFAGFIEASGRPQQAAQDWGPLTPDVADCMLVAMIGSDVNAATTFIWDSPWTERFDVTSASPTISATLATTLQSGGPSSQAVGGDWNHATNASGAAFVCALRPDAAGGIGPVARGGTLVAAASGTTSTPPLPSHQADDVAYVLAFTNAAHTMSTASAGWTEIAEYTTSNASYGLYYKRLTSGAEADPVIDWSAAGSTTQGHYAMAAVVRGAITTGTPHEDLTVNPVAGVDPTLSTTPASATVTSSEDGSLVLHFIGCDDDNTITLPGQGFPEDGVGCLWTDLSSLGGDALLIILEEYAAVAGDITGRTLLTQSASDFWRVISLVMIPAPSGPPPEFVRPARISHSKQNVHSWSY